LHVVSAYPCPVCDSSSVFVAGISGIEENPHVCLGCKTSFNYRGSELGRVDVDMSEVPEGCMVVYDMEEL
jgi:transposase-like protein